MERLPTVEVERDNSKDAVQEDDIIDWSSMDYWDLVPWEELLGDSTR